MRGAVLATCLLITLLFAGCTSGGGLGSTGALSRGFGEGQGTYTDLDLRGMSTLDGRFDTTPMLEDLEEDFGGSMTAEQLAARDLLHDHMQALGHERTIGDGRTPSWLMLFSATRDGQEGDLLVRGYPGGANHVYLPPEGPGPEGASTDPLLEPLFPGLRHAAGAQDASLCSGNMAEMDAGDASLNDLISARAAAKTARSDPDFANATGQADMDYEYSLGRQVRFECDDDGSRAETKWVWYISAIDMDAAWNGDGAPAVTTVEVHAVNNTILESSLGGIGDGIAFQMLLEVSETVTAGTIPTQIGGEQGTASWDFSVPQGSSTLYVVPFENPSGTAQLIYFRGSVTLTDPDGGQQSTQITGDTITIDRPKPGAWDLTYTFDSQEPNEARGIEITVGAEVGG